MTAAAPLFRSRRVLMVVALSVLWSLGGGISRAQAADAAVERTEAFINAFKKVRSGDNLSAADKKANQKVFVELDGFMDFATLTSRPLEPRAAKFSAKQKAQ